jgi:AhpD family alkylhydroperoxidase
MMLDWDGYRQELLERIGDLGRLTPATVRGYRELGDAGSKTAHLDAKTRELIALAVGVTRQCDGCIATHVHAARKEGATAGEIAEALGVALPSSGSLKKVVQPDHWVPRRSFHGPPSA